MVDVTNTSLVSMEKWERPPYVKMSQLALEMWQDKLQNQAIGSFYLIGKTPEELVEAYINVVRTLIEHCNDSDFNVSTYAPQPLTVECTLRNKKGLLNSLPPFQM
jgi:hypothetical protein